jgi:hypothetical protein
MVNLLAFIIISYLAAFLPAASGPPFSIEVYELFYRLRVAAKADLIMNTQPHWSSDRVAYPKIHVIRAEAMTMWH